jgi:hypothetical protein
MKKLTLITLFTISSLYGDWNWMSSLFKKEIPSIEYTVDASGKNPRVYEFDTQGYPRMHCVVFLRPDTTTSPAMSCVKMTKEDFEKNKKLAK